MIKKISGSILLILGIIIIFYSLYSSFNIFTAKSAAPDIFKMEVQVSSQNKGSSLEAQFQEIISEQLRGVIPASSVSGLLNLIAWSIFAGILVFGGAQISSLGIKLIT